MKKTTLLRKLLERDEILVYPLAYDCLIAKIIEKTGFEATGTTGFGMEATMLGKPDIGVLTLTEVVTRVKHMANTVKIPLIVDAESGYGNAINVIRTVQELEQAGAAGLFIQDQVFPGRCASMAGKEVVPMKEMIGKIKAAIDSRDDPDFMVIARTDAEVISIEEAVRRANAYLKAGADAVKPMPHTFEEYKFYAKSVKGPLFTYQVGTPREIVQEKGKSLEEITFRDLEELGYKAVSIPTVALFAATKAVMDLMEELKDKGTFKHYQERVNPPTREEFWQLMGRDEFNRLERKYLPLKK